jgi:uncharacterized protein (UPF0276 family)
MNQPSVISGAGVGLRVPHIQTILQENPDIPWFEVLVDNWLVDGGLNVHLMDAITERYPVVLHGVGLSLGSVDPLDLTYIKKVNDFKARTGAKWYSEHCSFSSAQGLFAADLFPLPYTQDVVCYLSERIKIVQDILGEQMLLENISAYVACPDNTLTEAEFLAAVVAESGCGLLLDINNVLVSCFNLGESVDDYFKQIPSHAVQQIHLAGHEDKGDYLLDSHGQRVGETVWRLFDAFIAQNGPVPTLIEWDTKLPAWQVLASEQKQAQTRLDALCFTDNIKKRSEFG